MIAAPAKKSPSESTLRRGTADGNRLRELEAQLKALKLESMEKDQRIATLTRALHDRDRLIGSLHKGKREGQSPMPAPSKTTTTTTTTTVSTSTAGTGASTHTKRAGRSESFGEFRSRRHGAIIQANPGMSAAAVTKQLALEWHQRVGNGNRLA